MPCYKPNFNKHSFTVKFHREALMNGVFVFSFHVLAHVRSYLTNSSVLTGCCAGLFYPLTASLNCALEPLIATEHWHRVNCLKSSFSHVSLVQVRASATPLPAVMEGRVTTTETPSCAAAPQAGVAAPATQVRQSLHSNYTVTALVMTV